MYYIIGYENELLAHPDDDDRGFLDDEQFDVFLSRFEHSTCSLSYAGIDAPGHALKDAKYTPSMSFLYV